MRSQQVKWIAHLRGRHAVSLYGLYCPISDGTTGVHNSICRAVEKNGLRAVSLKVPFATEPGLQSCRDGAGNRASALGLSRTLQGLKPDSFLEGCGTTEVVP